VAERLWAGWRIAYLKGAGNEEGDGASCLFCDLAERPPSVETLVLEAYRHAILMLNAFPYTSGHLMVAPRAHGDSLLAASPEARGEIQAAVERARRALAAEYRPDGFNIGANLGRAAGAGIPGHLHWHVVPRWQGDTNFVPVLADTRVLPEALSETYARLLGALAGQPQEGLTVTARGHVA
jgi:ATP adenylyltransferase